MSLSSYSIEDLQQRGQAGDEEAIAELGRRVMDFDFCLSDTGYCKHKLELHELQNDLASEVPPSCPKCDTWLTEK